jgi:hypothetical protein
MLLNATFSCNQKVRLFITILFQPVPKTIQSWRWIVANQGHDTGGLKVAYQIVCKPTPMLPIRSQEKQFCCS